MEAKYKRKLVPYQIYLRPDQVEKLREKPGMASELVRQAIDTIGAAQLDYHEGYQRGLEKAVMVISKSTKGKAITVFGKTLSDLMCDELQEHIDGLFGPLDQSKSVDERRV
jgi:hypothetical protein